MKCLVLSFGLLLMQITSAQLTIDIKNVPSSDGKIMLGVYSTASSFPKQNATYQNMIVKAKKGTTTIIIKDLPKGTYALAVYHDENGNQKIDKNRLGVPVEFYGFSNDARETFSAPSFDSAKLEYNNKLTTSITIK